MDAEISVIASTGSNAGMVAVALILKPFIVTIMLHLYSTYLMVLGTLQ